MVSSGVVRDVYHHHLNPNASEKKVKWLTYIVTAVIGVAAVMAALNPPQYLQVVLGGALCLASGAVWFGLFPFRPTPRPLRFVCGF